MKIEVKKDDVMMLVGRQLEYIGAKAGNWEQIRSTKYDEEQLMRAWGEACDQVMVELMPIIIQQTVNGEAMVVETENENGLDQRASAAASEAVAHYITAAWLTVPAPALVEIETGRQAQALTELVRFAYQRRLPWG